MVALLLSAILDLVAPAPTVGLQLTLSLTGGAVRDGQIVDVKAELKNLSGKALRVVWKPSGEQPLTLFVDGKEHPLPFGIATAALRGWVELKPGESVTEDERLVLAPGAHELSWRYTARQGPYGRPLERCWTGRLQSAPLKAQIPLH